MKKIAHSTYQKYWLGAAISFALFSMTAGPRSAFAQTNTFPSTGNVGIGTTSPTGPLHVSTSGTVSEVLKIESTTNNSNVVIGLKDGSPGQTRSMALNFINSSNLVQGQIAFFNNAVAGSQYMRFNTAGAERMRIDGAGNVGIGTTSPVSKLHLQVTSANTTTGPLAAADIGLFISNSDTTANNISAISFGNSAPGNQAQIGVVNIGSTVTAGGHLFFNTRTVGGGLAERMRIDSTGNVGIGTASPAGRLHLFSGGTTDNVLQYFQNGTRSWNLGINGVSDFFRITDQTAGLARLTILNSGNVGIGTTGPGYKLDVQGGQLNASGGLCIAGDCKTAWSQVGSSQWTTSGSNVYYNGGSVGIGIASPSNKLVVATTVAGDSMLVTSSAAGSGAAIDLTSTDTGGVTWRSQSLGNVASRIGNFGIVQVGLGTAIEVQKGTLNVGIGTTSPSERLQIHGSVKLSSDVISNGVRALTPTGWGYGPNAYRVLMVGAASGNETVSIGYDPSGITNGLFAGDGREVLFRDGATFTTPNAGANTFYYDTLVLKGGSVGIGTATPQYKLEVKGGLLNAYDGLCIAGVCKTDWSQVGGSQWISGTNSISYSAGNVGIGTPATQYKLDVNGNTNVTGNINITGNINAKFQDMAEWVPSSEEMPAGTVVVLDTTKSNQVIASSQAYDTRVAGVVSEQPGIALGEKGHGKVLVATIGRVLVRVEATNGPIHIGDLLVTSDIPGLAMKSEPITIGNRKIHTPGTLIGKALEPLEKGSGKILVLLSLQ